MKILHTVEFYDPSVGGMQEVVKQLSTRLAAMGHDVTVATTKLDGRTATELDGVRIAEFAIGGNTVRGMTGEVDRYREFLKTGGFDVVTLFAAQQWATDAALDVLEDIDAVKVMVPTGFSGLYLPEYRDYFSQMPGWLKAMDASVYLSEDYRDINFAREHSVNNTVLIPNGASETEFLAPPATDIRTKFGIAEDSFLILHVGSHTGSKGHYEAMRMVSRANIPGATFLLVASNVQGGCTRRCPVYKRLFSAMPARLWDKKRLIVTELSRQDTLAAYHAADLFLFPSNIECSPLVLFEAAASRTPFLTTDVGNAREITRWLGSGLVMPTVTNHEGLSRVRIAPGTRMLEEFHTAAGERAAMAERGFEAWRNNHTWLAIAEKYEALYQRLLTERAS